MKSCATTIGYAVIAAVGILVLIIAVSALVRLYTPRTIPASHQPTSNNVNRTVVISCEDCDEEGMAINLWADADASHLACQLRREVRIGEL